MKPHTRVLLINLAAALLLVLCLVANLVLVHVSIQSEHGLMNTATIIGRQRGRSYKLILDTLMLSRHLGHRDAVLMDLTQTENEWERVQQAAYNGDSGLGIPDAMPDAVDKEIQASIPHYDAMRAAIREVILKCVKYPDDPHIDIDLLVLLAHEDAYQLHFLAIYDNFTQLAHEQDAATERISLVLLGLTVLLCAALYGFVLRPVLKQSLLPAGAGATTRIKEASNGDNRL